MALATYSDSLPDTLDPVDDPGLGDRMSLISSGLSALVADLHPECLLGRDATSLYTGFTRLERLVEAGKFLLAPRIADSMHWEQEGHRSPEELLATLGGGSASQAKRTLDTGRKLHELPATEEAVRQGTLSGSKTTEIVQAAALDPDAEGSLLEGAEDVSLREVRERAHRVRATSSKRDPLAAFKRIHAHRSFSSWTDSEGAFCFQGRDTAERGAKMLAVLTPIVDRLRDDARAAARDAVAGSPPGTPPAKTEPEAAWRADALFHLITGRRSGLAGFPGLTGPDVSDGDVPGTTTGPTTGSTTGPTTGPTTACDLVPTTPPAMVMVRVDLTALRRGTVRPGEQCELDGHGPIPVPVAAHLLDDAFLAYVFTEAGDIKAISHHGRTINQRLRTALAFRDRRCVVPGCGVAYGLEIDHVVPMEHGGPTELENLALLCHRHHWWKTYEGWTLERTGPTDEDPHWTFTPQPPFGQEPGLGADRPPVPVPRT